MAEFSDQEFNIKKEDVLKLYERIKKFLMNDFDKKLLHHKKQDHKWYIQGTVHGICRALLIDKQVIIYLILGSNPRRPNWGDLKTKYDIEPLKFELRKDVVSLGKKLIDGYGFKLFFTDTNRNGDFHMKVIFYPFKEHNVSIVEDSKSSYASAVLKKVESSKIKQNEKDTKFEKMVTILANSSDEE